MAFARLGAGHILERASLSGSMRFQSSGRVTGLVGKSFVLPTLRVSDCNVQATLDGIHERVSLAPLFFKNAPVVLDFEECPRCERVEDYVEGLRGMDLRPVGVANLDPDLCASLPAFPTVSSAGPAPPPPVSRDADAKHALPSSEGDGDEAEGREGKSVAAMVLNESVRSGQQVYAHARDLVIIGSVHSGAEVLADGDIHVYGTLKGKAFAGCSGDENRSIFVQEFDGELVSIGNVFTLCEVKTEKITGAKATVISLNPKTDQIEFKAITPKATL